MTYVPDDAAGAAADRSDGWDVLSRDLKEVAVDVVLHVPAAVGERALDLRLAAEAMAAAVASSSCPGASTLHAHRPARLRTNTLIEELAKKERNARRAEEERERERDC